MKGTENRMSYLKRTEKDKLKVNKGTTYVTFHFPSVTTTIPTP